MSSNAKPLGTRAHTRGVLLRPRARGRRNVFAIVLPLLALTALTAAPAVAGAHSEPRPKLAVPGLAYATGTERSSPAVWVANANGGQAKRLGLGLEPLISPNGQWVAASAFGAVVGTQEQGPAIVVYSTAAGAPLNELSLATATAQPLAWSSDSRYLAVFMQSNSVTNIAQGSGLAVIDTTTGAVTTIAHGQIYGASFAQDGSDRIVYGRAPSQSPSAPVNLYMSGPDGSGRRALTTRRAQPLPRMGAEATSPTTASICAGTTPRAIRSGYARRAPRPRAGSRTSPSTGSSSGSCRSPSPPAAAGCSASSRGRTRATRGPCVCPRAVRGRSSSAISRSSALASPATAARCWSTSARSRGRPPAVASPASRSPAAGRPCSSRTARRPAGTADAAAIAARARR